ncbi:MAG TPA: tetratricopeptide repeat protein [Kofleriaceae bacterium]|nr:tetratricopeptide repeat protein [Kofleriaceae bacterium]
MKRAAWVVLACALASAAHASPKRKTTPDKFTRAASEAFIAAVAADQKGDLRAALGLYTKAFAISPHPSTAYNMADVQLRLNQVKEAMKSYETYLALAPSAPDRADVERLLQKLVEGPAVLTVKTTMASDPSSVSFKWMYVLVDGVIVKKPGVAPIESEQPRLNFDVAPGEHLVEVISDVTYGRRACVVKPAERNECLMTAPPRIDGTIVISGDDRLVIWTSPPSRKDRSPDSVLGKRITLPPGKRKLLVRDRNYECAPILVDVPGGSDLGYLNVTTKESDDLRRCRALDIKRLRLKFDP